jgi:hypothetical protein
VDRLGDVLVSRCRVDGCTYEGDTEAVPLTFRLEADGPEFQETLSMCPQHARAVRGDVSFGVSLADAPRVTHFGVKCETCGGLRPIESRPFPDGSGGEHVCSGCGEPFGGWMDGGLLDLGLVRDDQLNPDNDYEVFS